MRILIAAPRQDAATGNWATAARFQKGLSARGHAVSICAAPLDPQVLDQAVAAAAPELVILLHAFRTGSPWLGGRWHARLPYLVLMTGTDLNEGLCHPEQRPVIEEVVAGAAAVLVQNPLTVETLRCAHPAWSPRLHFLPPGIELGTAPCPLRRRHGIPRSDILFLCPASLRPVKGLLELLTLFDAVAARHGGFRVAFCGPELDADYARRFLAAVAERPWVTYLGVIPPAAMPAAIGEADVILNNSSSEGLPNALIEAAALGRPILARDIPGNAPIVEPEINGLLYQDTPTFIACATRLLTDAALRTKLSRPQPERYDPEHEAAELHRLCLLAVSG